MKKILLILSAITLLFVFTACGEKTPQEQKSDEPYFKTEGKSIDKLKSIEINRTLVKSLVPENPTERTLYNVDKFTLDGSEFIIRYYKDGNDESLKLYDLNDNIVESIYIGEPSAPSAPSPSGEQVIANTESTEELSVINNKYLLKKLRRYNSDFIAYEFYDKTFTKPIKRLDSYNAYDYKVEDNKFYYSDLKRDIENNEQFKVDYEMLLSGDELEEKQVLRTKVTLEENS